MPKSEPLSVKETVRRCLIHYPSLFSDKGSVFNHLFLVNGNGYEWEDGGLVARCQHRDGAEPRWADESGDGEYFESMIPEFDSALKRGRILRAKRENNQVRFVLENFDAIFEEPIIALCSVYPACRYSLLFTMPDNVRPDWKEACDETSRLLNQRLRYQEQEHFRPGTNADKLNRNFRKKHFAKKDAEMLELFRSIVPVKQAARACLAKSRSEAVGDET